MIKICVKKQKVCGKFLLNYHLVTQNGFVTQNGSICIPFVRLDHYIGYRLLGTKTGYMVKTGLELSIGNR